jgi:hypothetical protein
MEAKKEELRPLPYWSLKKAGLFYLVLGATISAEHLDGPEDYRPRIARLKRLLGVIPEKQRKDREEVENALRLSSASSKSLKTGEW